MGVSKLHSASPGNVLKIFLKKKRWVFSNLCTLNKKVSKLCKKDTAGFPKLQPKCPDNILRKTLWRIDNISVIFVLWEKNFRSLREKIQGRVLKITFYVSMRAFWQNTFPKNHSFSLNFVTWAKKFRTSSEIFRDFSRKHMGNGFQNLNLRVQGYNLRKGFLTKLMVS